MIFATIGTQAPFDRFIKIIDEIAPELHEDVIVQNTSGSYIPKNISAIGFISPEKFDTYIEQARIVVAHAGMGSIISALSKGKNIIVFPRLASLGEHRNEHQTATAKRLQAMGHVYAAYSSEELRQLLLTPTLPTLKPISDTPSQSLINSIIDFIDHT